MQEVHQMNSDSFMCHMHTAVNDMHEKTVLRERPGNKVVNHILLNVQITYAFSGF